MIGTEVVLVRIRRPDGTEKVLKVAYDHLDRVLALANDEFGDPSIALVGPELPKERT